MTRTLPGCGPRLAPAEPLSGHCHGPHTLARTLSLSSSAKLLRDAALSALRSALALLNFSGIPPFSLLVGCCALRCCDSDARARFKFSQLLRLLTGIAPFVPQSDACAFISPVSLEPISVAQVALSTPIADRRFAVESPSESAAASRDHVSHRP